jgi:propanol-preferring alcohol dehydrogenase
VVALAEQGRLHAETETYPLADAMVAYDRLRTGQVRGRAVVVPTL